MQRTVLLRPFCPSVRASVTLSVCRNLFGEGNNTVIIEQNAHTKRTHL